MELQKCSNQSWYLGPFFQLDETTAKKMWVEGGVYIFIDIHIYMCIKFRI